MTTREEIREGIQHLWCQHCKALQKSNDTIVECWYNPLDAEGHYAFCVANEDAVDAILKDESDKGVAIKVDRELLSNPFLKSDPRRGGYERAKDDMAGYVAVESLVEEK